MERDGLVVRTVHSVAPPKVAYRLTDLGSRKPEARTTKGATRAPFDRTTEGSVAEARAAEAGGETNRAAPIAVAIPVSTAVIAATEAAPAIATPAAEPTAAEASTAAESTTVGTAAAAMKATTMAATAVAPAMATTVTGRIGYRRRGDQAEGREAQYGSTDNHHFSDLKHHSRHRPLLDDWATCDFANRSTRAQLFAPNVKARFRGGLPQNHAGRSHAFYRVGRLSPRLVQDEQSGYVRRAKWRRMSQVGAMRSVRFFGLGLAALAVVAAVAEQRHFEAGTQTAMVVTDPSKAVMRPAPITASWMIEGTPTTLAAEIAHTDDGSTKTYVWSTTKSRFHWFYDSDEIVTVLDGEVFVDDGINGERRLGPGDVAFFPAGAKTTWHVPDHLRKVATLKRPLPSPFANVVRWLKAVKQAIRPSTSAFAAS